MIKAFFRALIVSHLDLSHVLIGNFLAINSDDDNISSCCSAIGLKRCICSRDVL